MTGAVGTTLTRRYRFCASHRLHSPTLSAAANQQMFGKCNNPYGHGHDYVLSVSVTGEVDARTGLIIRLADLDKLVEAEILTRFDHRNLNVDVAEFLCLVPTTENLAVVIADRLKAQWNSYFPCGSARLSGILIEETDRNHFELAIPKPAPRLEDQSQLESQAVSIGTHESVIVNV